MTEKKLLALIEKAASEQWSTLDLSAHEMRNEIQIIKVEPSLSQKESVKVRE